jgi:hypothetical protein
MVFGRASLLTDETQTNICNALRAGNFREIAAGAFGVAPSTLYRWLDLGKPDRPCVTPEESAKQRDAGPCAEAAAGRPHPPGTCPDLSRHRDFRQAVERAEHEHEVRAVTEITQAGKRDADAHWKILRAKYPERWNVPQRTEIAGPGGGAIVLTTPREEMLARIEQVRRRAIGAGEEAEDERPKRKRTAG